MFTGLVTDIGELLAANRGKFRIACSYELDNKDIGVSISCDGCCLTVTSVEKRENGGSIFDVDVSNETLYCTTLKHWVKGHQINLERSLTPSSELGGHIVSGHVDGTAVVSSRKQDGDSVRFMLDAPKELAKFIAPKGSVALNGVSLTVNEAQGASFSVNLIPHTLSSTSWGEIDVRDVVNLEVDLLARYVARITQADV